MSELEAQHPARVEVFGSVFCPYCSQVRRYLAEKGISYTYREVPMLFGFKFPLKAYREMKSRSGGQKTVPQIFIDGVYFGDEERLFAEDGEGKLDVLVDQPPRDGAEGADGSQTGTADREPAH